MKKFRILPLIIFVFVAFISCDAQTKKKTTANTAKKSVENIISVAVHYSAGRAGFYKLTASKDQFQIESAGRMTDANPNSTRKTTAQEWTNLTSGLNNVNFASIKSGERTSLYDGPENVFTIVTKDGTFEIINPDKTAGKALYDLKTMLEGMRIQGGLKK